MYLIIKQNKIKYINIWRKFSFTYVTFNYGFTLIRVVLSSYFTTCYLNWGGGLYHLWGSGTQGTSPQPIYTGSAPHVQPGVIGPGRKTHIVQQSYIYMGVILRKRKNTSTLLGILNSHMAVCFFEWLLWDTSRSTPTTFGFPYESHLYVTKSKITKMTLLVNDSILHVHNN